MGRHPELQQKRWSLSAAHCIGVLAGGLLSKRWNEFPCVTVTAAFIRVLSAATRATRQHHHAAPAVVNHLVSRRGPGRLEARENEPTSLRRKIFVRLFPLPVIYRCPQPKRRAVGVRRKPWLLGLSDESPRAAFSPTAPGVPCSNAGPMFGSDPSVDETGNSHGDTTRMSKANPKL